MMLLSRWVVLVLAALLLLNATVVAGGGEEEEDGGVVDLRVCGDDSVTYETAEACRASGARVVHCGNCGACSTAHDIGIYWDTKDTLTRTATICAYSYLFLGRYALDFCLEKLIGFTQPCKTAWYDNVICTVGTCLGTCLNHIIKKGMNWGSLNLEDDPCLLCDETMCGPGFMNAAGANRRRVGIESDIARPSYQMCTEIDIDLSPSAAAEEEESAVADEMR
jgi:hypothetical protein